MVTQNILRKHRGKLMGLFVEKNIRFVTALDLTPLTDRITEIAPYVRTYF